MKRFKFDKIVTLLLLALMFVNCEHNLEMTLPQGPKGDKGDKGDPGISAFEMWKQFYNKGPETTIEDFFNSLKGKDGKNGAVPVIGDNGNWIIDGIDTGIPARGQDGQNGQDGEDGKDGITPVIGENGNWIIDGTDTGIPAAGKDGQDGITPHIGDNGNWFIGDNDTGIPAQGENGVTPRIGSNGNWHIGLIDTGIPATGPQGPSGVDGKTAYELWKDAVDNGSMTNKDGTPYTGTNSWESFLTWLQGGDISVLYKFWISKGNSGDMDDFLEALFDCHCDGIKVSVVHPSACVSIDPNGNVTGSYPATITLTGDAGTSFILKDGTTTLDQGTIGVGDTDITFVVLRDATRDIHVLITATHPSKPEQISKTALVRKLSYLPLTAVVVNSATTEEDMVTLTFNSAPSELLIDGTAVYSLAGGILNPAWSVDASGKVFTRTYSRESVAKVYSVTAKGVSEECSSSAFQISQLTPVSITVPAALNIVPGNTCDLLITLTGTPGMTVTASYPNPNSTSQTLTVTLAESATTPGEYSLLGIPRTYSPYNVLVRSEKAGAGTVLSNLSVSGALLLDILDPVSFVNNNGSATSDYINAIVTNQFTNETTSPVTLVFTSRTGGTSGSVRRGSYPFQVTLAPGETKNVDFYRDYTMTYTSGYYTVNYRIEDGCGRVLTRSFRINNQSNYSAKFTKPTGWGGSGEPGGPGQPGYPNTTPINPGDPLDVDIQLQVELFDAIPSSYFQFQLFTGIGHNTVIVGQVQSDGYYSGMVTIKASELDKALRNGIAKFNFFQDSAYQMPINIGSKSNVPFTF